MSVFLFDSEEAPIGEGLDPLAAAKIETDAVRRRPAAGYLSYFLRP
jgi:hypothetical protein